MTAFQKCTLTSLVVFGCMTSAASAQDPDPTERARTLRAQEADSQKRAQQADSKTRDIVQQISNAKDSKDVARLNQELKAAQQEKNRAIFDIYQTRQSLDKVEKQIGSSSGGSQNPLGSRKSDEPKPPGPDGSIPPHKPTPGEVFERLQQTEKELRERNPNATDEELHQLLQRHFDGAVRERRQLNLGRLEQLRSQLAANQQRIRTHNTVQPTNANVASYNAEARALNAERDRLIQQIRSLEGQ